MTRRRFGMLVLAAVLLAGMALPGFGGGARTARAQDAALPEGPVEIEVWWWGETEAPGSEKWLEAAQAAYVADHPNVTFKNNLLSVDALLPSYEAAGQAKQGPTIMYLWGGIYTMDAAWKGWITPISDLVGMEEASHYINKEEATFEGKVWSAAWYLQPSYPLVYNKAAFEEAGDPFHPETAAKLEKHILSAGGSEEAEVLYTRFRGRMPGVEALLKGRGLLEVA